MTEPPRNLNISTLRDWNQVNKRRGVYILILKYQEMDRKRNDLFSTERRKEALQTHGFMDAAGNYV